MTSWCRRLPDGALILVVHAQPGAKRTEAAGAHGEALRIRVAAPATEDRANAALVEFIADTLGVARRNVALEGGARSRLKRFRVTGVAAGAETALAGEP